MSPTGHNQPRRPDQLNGLRVGDHVITPLGRHATITGLRVDGYVDASYDNQHPTLAAVILQPHTLKKATP